MSDGVLREALRALLDELPRCLHGTPGRWPPACQRPVTHGPAGMREQPNACDAHAEKGAPELSYAVALRSAQQAVSGPEYIHAGGRWFARSADGTVVDLRSTAQAAAELGRDYLHGPEAQALRDGIVEAQYALRAVYLGEIDRVSDLVDQTNMNKTLLRGAVDSVSSARWDRADEFIAALLDPDARLSCPECDVDPLHCQEHA